MDFLDAQLLKNPSAMQESLVQYQVQQNFTFYRYDTPTNGPLTILWCLSANSEQLEIIARLRERNRFRESTKPGSD